MPRSEPHSPCVRNPLDNSALQSCFCLWLSEEKHAQQEEDAFWVGNPDIGDFAHRINIQVGGASVFATRFVFSAGFFLWIYISYFHLLDPLSRIEECLVQPPLLKSERNVEKESFIASVLFTEQFNLAHRPPPSPVDTCCKADLVL